MQRFSSLDHVPSETRRVLRSRLSRFLPTGEKGRNYADPEEMVSDETMLLLLQNLYIDYQSELLTARATYDQAQALKPEEPGFDEIIEAGWLRVVWGRVQAPHSALNVAKSFGKPSLTALTKLLTDRFQRNFRLTAGAERKEAIAALASLVMEGQREPESIICQSPAWVAARLWDRKLPELSERATALREWVDRWKILGSPSFAPADVWSQQAADIFREAAFKILETDLHGIDWNEFRTNYIKQLALVGKQKWSEVENNVNKIPSTLIEKAEWISRPGLERELMALYDAFSDFVDLSRLLLADVDIEPNSLAPHDTASKLFGIAINCPILLLAVTDHIRFNPTLLADFILYPPTTALACRIIGEWASVGGAWDRQLLDRDDQTTKHIAFADAASVLGYLLRKEEAPPMEAATLLCWVQASKSADIIYSSADGEMMLSALRGELVSLPPAIVQEIIAHILVSPQQTGLGSNGFAAAIDLLEFTDHNNLELQPLIASYIDSIEGGKYDLSARGIGSGAAALLCKLALKSPDSDRFLTPLNLLEKLRSNTEDDFYAMADTLARSIRAHVRVLCRAVVGWNETPPEAVIEALTRTIRSGSRTDKESGRIAAFAPRHEEGYFGPAMDRTIAVDIGAALRALSGDQLQLLLDAIVEINEPMVLAQLISAVPFSCQYRLSDRLDALIPSESAEIYSFHEVQARISAMLSAGVAATAERFFADEQTQEAFERVPRGKLLEFENTLRLHVIRDEWHEIETCDLPVTLSEADLTSAHELLLFYQGISAINSRKNYEHAETIFAGLSETYPNVAPYKLNLFAAQVGRLLRDDLFKLLSGPDLRKAHVLINESEHTLAELGSSPQIDTASFICNRALLLLGARRPEQALQILATVRVAQQREATLRAVALSRTDRTAEAIATIDQAIETFGNTAELMSARAHIASGEAFNAVISISTEIDDPITRIQNAFFELGKLDPYEQAKVLGPSQSRGGDPFLRFTIELVRSVAASLVGLAASLPERPREDDLNTIIRELLRNRLEFIKWSVSDQSLGGFTAKGNPGERDFVILDRMATLAIAEAIVCDRPTTQQFPINDLIYHFQKLLGYDNCRLFFHITYAYIDDPETITPKLEDIARNNAPSGFRYARQERIRFNDSRPTGLVAYYNAGVNEIAVVFLVLDMQQARQREAAAQGGVSNPRNKTSKASSQAAE